ncbi:alanine racemase [Propionivibrio dicarboxylicus]|uniref:Alanine racemase n=1 Tax=Propionivibrio dicarboxylicus TaxID=83767 RepID=A0A1G8MLV5_9RHOO|nr:alanine racemase [Propionivibrio dicarboxylicus]SDI68971.1 alanine racemase [Propionivibrio dicarboxylicus]
MSRPIQASIDLASLRHNYGIAKDRARICGKSSKVLPVVKANAYGHGLMRVANALRDVADGFALLDVGDAVSLREAGFSQPILLLEGFFDEADLAACLQHQLIPAVHRVEQFSMLRRQAATGRLPVFVKLNTGMNRLGFTADDVSDLRKALAMTEAVSDVTLMTHFAEADGAKGVEWQVERFDAIRALWPECRNYAVSMANSAALLRYPETIADVARPGVMLYGGSPFDDVSAADLGLEPVMTLSSEVLAIHDIAAGESVGYGGTFVADRPMRIGVVACGYADGYPRHASTGTPILVNGVRTRTLGRVSMDMLVCDLTEISDASVGSPVVLWGRGLPADDVARAAGTICYELFCALARRVPVVEV